MGLWLIGKLSDALWSRKISASELLEPAIARIEALDQHLKAIFVRDFDRAKDTLAVTGGRTQL
jgi:amidase